MMSSSSSKREKDDIGKEQMMTSHEDGQKKIKSRPFKNIRKMFGRGKKIPRFFRGNPAPNREARTSEEVDQLRGLSLSHESIFTPDVSKPEVLVRTSPRAIPSTKRPLTTYQYSSHQLRFSPDLRDELNVKFGLNPAMDLDASILSTSAPPYLTPPPLQPIQVVGTKNDEILFDFNPRNSKSEMENKRLLNADMALNYNAAYAKIAARPRNRKGRKGHQPVRGSNGLESFDLNSTMFSSSEISTEFSSGNFPGQSHSLSKGVMDKENQNTNLHGGITEDNEINKNKTVTNLPSANLPLFSLPSLDDVKQVKLRKSPTSEVPPLSPTPQDGKKLSAILFKPKTEAKITDEKSSKVKSPITVSKSVDLGGDLESYKTTSKNDSLENHNLASPKSKKPGVFAADLSREDASEESVHNKVSPKNTKIFNVVLTDISSEKGFKENKAAIASHNEHEKGMSTLAEDDAAQEDVGLKIPPWKKKKVNANLPPAKSTEVKEQSKSDKNRNVTQSMPEMSKISGKQTRQKLIWSAVSHKGAGDPERGSSLASTSFPSNTLDVEKVLSKPSVFVSDNIDDKNKPIVFTRLRKVSHPDSDQNVSKEQEKSNNYLKTAKADLQEVKPAAQSGVNKRNLPSNDASAEKIEKHVTKKDDKEATKVLATQQRNHNLNERKLSHGKAEKEDKQNDSSIKTTAINFKRKDNKSSAAMSISKNANQNNNNKFIDPDEFVETPSSPVDVQRGGATSSLPFRHPSQKKVNDVVHPSTINLSNLIPAPEQDVVEHATSDVQLSSSAPAWITLARKHSEKWRKDLSTAVTSETSPDEVKEGSRNETPSSPSARSGVTKRNASEQSRGARSSRLHVTTTRSLDEEQTTTVINDDDIQKNCGPRETGNVVPTWQAIALQKQQRWSCGETD